MGLRQIEQEFSSYFAKFDDFHSTLRYAIAQLWKIMKYGKSLTINDGNPWSTCLKPISQSLNFQNSKFETWVSGTRYITS